ncbi:MAG: single-stranded DNA-binding protein [Bacteroidota bacterium]
MKNLRNRVNLIGNLGTDPEMKTMDGGQKLAKISIATNESYKNNKGEKITETQWHNLVAWGKTAEYFEKYAKTGSQAVIEGKLMNRNYTDKSGVKRYTTEIVVEEVMLLGPINRNENG